MRADDGVGGGDRPYHPAPRPRVGHDGPPEPLGEREHPVGLGRLGRHAADHDDPTAPQRLPDCNARLILADDDPRPRARWQVASRPGQGLAEGKVEVNRARARRPLDRLAEGPGGQWPPRPLLTRRGDAWCGRPPHRRAVQIVLVDRLGCPGVVQLGRSIRSAHDQGNPGVVRLDNGGMQLNGRRAARHADDRRPSGGRRQSQGEEGGTALIEPDVGPEATCQSHRERSRPRARADHRLGDPESRPFVDQSGAEGGLYAHPTCHSMSRCGARARRWWCCTASPRRVGSSVASAST